MVLSDRRHPWAYPSALGVDLDPETHDIHHLLAVTPVRSIHRMIVLAPLAVRGMSSSAFLRLTNFVAGRNCATVQNAAQLT